jgi:hypothetical protein
VGYQTGECGFCIFKSTQTETGTEWVIRQGKADFVFPRAYKLKLELVAMSDWGERVFYYQEHPN